MSDCPDGGRAAGEGGQEHGWPCPGRYTPRDHEIVGVHMVGPRAAAITKATPAVKFGLTAAVTDTVHLFPTFSEAFKQTYQAFRRDTSTMSCCVEWPLLPSQEGNEGRQRLR